MTTASPAIVDTDGSREQVWPLPTDEQSLLDLIHLCFEQYWDDIWFGVLIQGAAWEVAAPNPPKRISMYDGYATIDFGRWHFHLCIGEHKASFQLPVPDPLRFVTSPGLWIGLVIAVGLFALAVWLRRRREPM